MNPKIILLLLLLLTSGCATGGGTSDIYVVIVLNNRITKLEEDNKKLESRVKELEIENKIRRK